MNPIPTFLKTDPKSRWTGRSALVVMILGSILTSCGCKSTAQNPLTPSPVSITQTQERDEILSLLAYSIVYKDWQEIGESNLLRGYNVGAILVRGESDIVSWGRNCSKITSNGTQHAEVRAILSELDRARTYYLTNCTIYTSLEPCVQCAGMMMQVKVSRVVYGQTDPHFGRAFERLSYDSSHSDHGYKPYPRALRSERSSSRVCWELDETARASTNNVADFLYSTPAKHIYQRATHDFLHYKPTHPENVELYDKARAFFDSVPNGYQPLNLRF